ncbi:PspC domain-containing protein [Paenibacillus sp. GYB003]
MKKLYRSQRDKKLFGICGGLAELLQVDSTLLRLIIVVTTFFTGGVLIPIYILAALVVPKEPGFESAHAGHWNHYGPGPGYQAYTAAPGAGYGYRNAPNYNAAPNAGTQPESQSNIDGMMKDIESKAMWNEIQELKAKLSKYEKGDV